MSLALVRDESLPASSSAFQAVAALRDDLANASGTPKGDALIGVLQPYSGAAARTQHAKNSDVVSALDFGADPTGAGDSAAAFVAAAATAKLVWRPKGAYKRSGVTRTYSTDGFEGVLWVGNGTINNSDDAQIVISRDVDNAGSGNGHAFTDSSNLARSGGVSYNSFDARITTSGANNFGHYAAFQVGSVFNSTGTVGDLFSFITSPVINSGTLTNYYGLMVNAPTISAPGAVTNCYGIYFPLGYGKGGAGFNQASGLVFPFYNESRAMVYSRGPVQGADGLIAGNAAGSNYVNVKTIDAVTSAGTEAALRLQQVGVNTWDMRNPASQTYLSLVSAAGEQLRMLNSGGIQAGADNASSLGSGSVRWSTVYAASGTINTSDERAKQDIGGIPVEWLRAWGRVEWARYRFRDAVESKGDGARWHVGLVAQRVRDVFAAAGIDALSLGLLCHDTWADEWEHIPEERRTTGIMGEDGQPITVLVRPADRRLARPAGDRWGIRYDEALAMECAYLRWRAEGGV